MKRFFSILTGIALLTGSAIAQDSLYIYKGGNVVEKRATTQIDSIIFYKVGTVTTTPIGTITTPPKGTPTVGSMSDGENNSYKTVTYGTQTWMAENLRVTKYNDGTTIPTGIAALAWGTLTTGAVCTYKNTSNADTIKTFGRLYNWYAVNTAKLCPTGWHVPSDGEWTTLQNYLIANGYNYDGSKTGNYIAQSMASTTGWASSKYPGDVGLYLSYNNKSGFTAQPSGALNAYGSFFGNGSKAYWWSTTELDSYTAQIRYLFSENKYFDNPSIEKVGGLSVRCLKN